MVSSSTPVSQTGDRDSSTELIDCGWRMSEILRPDGTTEYITTPLTEQQFLHPQEGDRLPNSTFHDSIAGDAKDMLTRRYLNDPTVGIFRDLLIKWDIDLGDHCPDTFVAFGIQNKEQNRTNFIVRDEGALPILVIEVVSPRFRKADREEKVVHYATAGVQEYVIFDRRRVRKQVLEEVLGYRLVNGHYQPIMPDEDDRILCRTVGLWISLQQGQVVMEDAQTGERLKTSAELEQENQAMAALLDRYRSQFGDLPT
jgi:Uma2 family endonuclease